MKLETGLKTPREKRMAAAFLGLLICVTFWRFWYKPKAASIASARGSLVSLRAEIETESQNLKALARMAPDKAALSRFDAEIIRMIESNSNYTNLIRKLSSDTVSGEDIRVKKIAVEKQETVSEFNRIDLALELVGTYVAVGKFLESLEKSKLLTEVSTIEMKRLPSGEMKRCAIKIKLAGYVARSS